MGRRSLMTFQPTKGVAGQTAIMAESWQSLLPTILHHIQCSHTPLTVCRATSSWINSTINEHHFHIHHNRSHLPTSCFMCFPRRQSQEDGLHDLKRTTVPYDPCHSFLGSSINGLCMLPTPGLGLNVSRN